MNYPERIDLHMHTTISDGTDTPREILERVKETGLGLFSVTDHDSIKATRLLRGIRQDDDPLFIPGVEFSCKDELGKYHILGYGYDPEGKSIRAVVDNGHRLRFKKVRARMDFLRERFGFSFPESEVERLFALDNPGKPHIGNLMVRYGYASTKEEAINKFINQIHFHSEYVRPEEAIEGILGAGGIPVLAHPSYGSGDQLILGEEMDARLRRLTEMGLQGVEAYYSGFTSKLREEMLAFAGKYDLFVTAGSDYHGTNKLVVLGDTGCENAAEGPEGMRRFLDAILPRL